MFIRQFLKELRWYHWKFIMVEMHNCSWNIWFAGNVWFFTPLRLSCLYFDIIKMVWCAAVGCSNYKKKNRDLTFFNFPRDKEIADAWKAKIKRKDLPKVIYVWKEFWSFDKSVDLRNSLHTSLFFSGKESSLFGRPRLLISLNCPRLCQIMSKKIWHNVICSLHKF